MKETKFQLRVDESTLDRWMEEADSRGLTLSSLIRRTMDSELAREIGEGASGSTATEVVGGPEEPVVIVSAEINEDEVSVNCKTQGSVSVGQLLLAMEVQGGIFSIISK